jgi:outer membrane receptor for ferrienterochelin and colicin
MKRIFVAVLLMLSSQTFGQEIEDVSLSDLLNLDVVTTSKVKSESAFDAPGIVAVMTSEEIRRFGGNNLRDILSRFNGIYLTGSGLMPSGPVSLRGDLGTHFNNHVLILIDGRPMRDSALANDSAFFRTFPVDVIDRIEMVRGPGSVLYGTNAMSGVVNIITKSKAENSVRLGYGSDSANIARGLVGSGTALAAVQYFSDQGQNLEQYDRTGVYGKDNYSHVDGGGFGVFRKDGWKMTAFQGSTREDHLGPLQLYGVGIRPMNSRKLFVDVNYENKWSDKSTGNYYFTYNQHWTDFEGKTTVADEHAHSSDMLVETTQLFAITDKVDVTAGGLVEKKTAISNNARNKVNEEQYSLYAQAKYQPIKVLGLTAGAQGNKVEQQNKWEVVPRAGVIYNQDNKWGAKVLYGKAFRSPTLVERFVNSGTALQGNPNLKPETVTTVDVQLLARVSDFNLAVSYFDSTYKDVITRTVDTCNGVAGANCYVNTGERNINGWEFDGKWIPNSSILVNMGLTLQQNDDSGVEDNALTPNTIAKLGASYTFSGISIGVNDSYYSRPKTVVGTVRNEDQSAYHYLQANLNVDLEKLMKCKDSSLEFYANNLMGDAINHPDFNRRQVNTIAQDDGVSYYGSYIRRF